jgi:hypothetical protein
VPGDFTKRAMGHCALVPLALHHRQHVLVKARDVVPWNEPILTSPLDNTKSGARASGDVARWNSTWNSSCGTRMGVGRFDNSACMPCATCGRARPATRHLTVGEETVGTRDAHARLGRRGELAVTDLLRNRFALEPGWSTMQCRWPDTRSLHCCLMTRRPRGKKCGLLPAYASVRC